MPLETSNGTFAFPNVCLFGDLFDNLVMVPMKYLIAGALCSEPVRCILEHHDFCCVSFSCLGADVKGILEFGHAILPSLRRMMKLRVFSFEPFVCRASPGYHHQGSTRQPEHFKRCLYTTFGTMNVSCESHYSLFSLISDRCRCFSTRDILGCRLRRMMKQPEHFEAVSVHHVWEHVRSLS